MITEAVLMGDIAYRNIAYRIDERIEWDAANMRVANTPRAKPFLAHEYRKGWRL